MNFFKRLISTLICIFLIFVLSKALLRLLPGDPLDFLLGETAVSIPREKIAEDLGLNLGWLDSYQRDFSRIFRGDFGYSLITREPILPNLIAKFQKTLLLSFGALVIATLVALPTGIYCSINHQSKKRIALANFLRFLTTVSVTLPLAWIGPALLYLFSVSLPWAEFHGSLGLAALALSLPFSGNWSRIIELRTREEMSEPFFRTALAQGMPLWRSILKSALAPALGSLLAIFGSQLGGLLAGSALTEIIFDWPGLGSLWIQATLQRDYPVMEAAMLLSAVTCLGGVLAGDFLQWAWDPRQRQGSK